MPKVKDNWKDVKVGDRVRVRSDLGTDAFEATVVVKGTQNAFGHVNCAWFTDNVTLKVDGTPRKKSAKERRNQTLYGYSMFEVVHVGTQVSIPKTAGELTDAHIGMRFRFHGEPAVEGIFNGFVVDYYTDYDLRIHIADATDPSANHWATYGYFIDKTRKLTYLGGDPKKVDETVDIDAKLAAYFNQELGRYFTDVASAPKTWPEAHKLGQEIVRIMKTLTK